MNFPTYRQAGLLMTAGYPLETMMNQIYSNSADPLLGRQLPIMYSSKETASSRSPATLARSSFRLWAGPWRRRSWRQQDRRRLDRRRRDSGDPTFTPRWSLPPPTARRSSSTSSTTNGRSRPSRALPAARQRHLPRADLASASLPLRVDGNDYLAVHAVAKWAAERAHLGHGATLIEHVTYRAGRHSTSDDPSGYRPKTEAADWPLGDPLERLKTHLIASGVW